MGVLTPRVALERVVELALEAGAAVMQFYGRPCDVENKGAAGPVTAADRAAHGRIIRELTRWDPDTPIVSEEAPVPGYELRREWQRFWLVDPLDGTKEFLANNGEFTVNIALVESGEPVLGVVVAPALDIAYFAARDGGAWKRESDGASIRLCPDGGDGVVTRLVESRSHPSPELEAFIATLGPVERTRLGSSLKFCRVAEGSSDIYPRFGPTMEWDLAAGDCVYRNSGTSGRQRPSPLAYNQPSLSTSAFVIGHARHSRASVSIL
jgi:3'(2'), 5'-bisphosphate nucleotidase